jgi:hypothetical protein
MDYKNLKKLLYSWFHLRFLIVLSLFDEILPVENDPVTHTHTTKKLQRNDFFSLANFCQNFDQKNMISKVFFREKRPKFARLNDKFHEVVKYGM